MSLKILTIDDSKTIRLIVAKAFKPFDCTVLEATNGLEGLAVANREQPDLLLLDYTMPVMDGFEVLARLRSEPELKDTPVIMLTAEAGRETVLKIAKLGVRDYLIKPFKEELLVERVKRVVPLKPKSDAVQRPKRFDDPISLVVVDDKPAILEQIRAGLAHTPWQMTNADQPGQALDLCLKQPVDIVLVSLTLPKDGAYMLFQNLRGCAATSALPLLGLSVKTAADEQTRALQTGFAGIVSKPLDIEDLKAKVCRALRLETSYKYYQQRDRALVLTLPGEVHPAMADEVALHLDAQLTAAVDAGLNQLLVDLSAVSKATLPVIKLVLTVMQAAGQLSVKCRLVASAPFSAECLRFQEAQNWPFVATVAEALALPN